MLEKTLESLLDCKIKPVNPKGNQPCIFSRRTDAEAEAPILWPPDVKSQLIVKDPDDGKDWGQDEKWVTEDGTVGWHHWLNRHEFEQTPGDSEGQGSLSCWSPWGHRELDMINNWTKTTTRKLEAEAPLYIALSLFLSLLNSSCQYLDLVCFGDQAFSCLCFHNASHIYLFSRESLLQRPLIWLQGSEKSSKMEYMQCSVTWRRKWQPTPVFLPGESCGQRSLVGCCPWGYTESDMTEAT